MDVLPEFNYHILKLPVFLCIPAHFKAASTVAVNTVSLAL